MKNLSPEEGAWALKPVTQGGNTNEAASVLVMTPVGDESSKQDSTIHRNSDLSAYKIIGEKRLRSDFC